MKTNKYGYSESDLRESAKFVRSLDAEDLVSEFLKFKHGCPLGSWAAMVLSLEGKETYCINEASECCSSEEYFSEKGRMSRKTILRRRQENCDMGTDEFMDESMADSLYESLEAIAKNLDEEADKISLAEPHD